MNARGVEHLDGARNAEEARRLLIRLAAEARNLEQLGTVQKLAVRLAVFYDILSHRRAYARNIRKQRIRRRVEVDADRVDAVLNNARERLVEPRLLHIVLILPDADRLGVDLDELGNGILKATRYRHRRALRDVKIRELLGAELGRRIDRRARLADHYVLAVARSLLEKSGDEYLALL